MAEELTRRERLRSSKVQVGVLLVLALAITFYAVWRIGELFNLFVPRYELVTLVSSAAGLLPGAPVTLAGQRVGLVKEIDFLPVGTGGSRHLSVKLSIAERVREYIRTDSYARIRTQGFLGDKFVDISVGSPVLPVVSPGDTIPSLPAAEFEEILVRTANALESVQGLIDNLRTITDGIAQGQGTLGRLLEDDLLYNELVGAVIEARELIHRINTEDGTLNRLLTDPTLYDGLTRALSRVDTLGTEILHGGGTLSQILGSDELYLGVLGSVARADSILAVLGATLTELTVGDGTVQKLLTDPDLYDQLLKTIIDLQVLIADIRENPRRYRPEVRIDIF